MNRPIYPTTIQYFNTILATGKRSATLVSESPARILLAGQVREISEDRNTITLYDGTGSVSLNSHAEEVFPFNQNDVVRMHLLMPTNTTASPKTLFYEKLPNAEALLVHFLSAMNALRLTDDRTKDDGMGNGQGSVIKDAGDDFLNGFGGGQAAFY